LGSERACGREVARRGGRTDAENFGCEIDYQYDRYSLSPPLLPLLSLSPSFDLKLITNLIGAPAIDAENYFKFTVWRGRGTEQGENIFIYFVQDDPKKKRTSLLTQNLSDAAAKGGTEGGKGKGGEEKEGEKEKGKGDEKDKKGDEKEKKVDLGDSKKGAYSASLPNSLARMEYYALSPPVSSLFSLSLPPLVSFSPSLFSLSFLSFFFIFYLFYYYYIFFDVK
jgi:hypothetical protein